MANASKIVTTWIGGILSGPAKSAAHHLSPNLDWQENGVPYAKARKKNKRPTWKGLQHPAAKLALTPKLRANGNVPPPVIDLGKYRLTRTEVCSSKNSVVMEFEVGPKGKEQRFCGVFQVDGDHITAAHWFGDPAAFVEMGRAFMQT